MRTNKKEEKEKAGKEEKEEKEEKEGIRFEKEVGGRVGKWARE